MVESKKIIIFERNIVEEQCNLVNEFKFKLLTRIYTYFHTKNIIIYDIIAFVKNPCFPGKVNGLKQIATVLLNTEIGKDYKKIQESGFTIKEFHKQVFDLIFQKGGDIGPGFLDQPHSREHEGKSKQIIACSKDRFGMPGTKLEARERMPSEAPLPLNKNEK